ncbi:Na(+)/H(+) antiporter NhaA [Dyadobacter sp. CECT 9623]|uniref:Na(+)/H(+) antiporter NhaA n=1 Tax=Dyadobacter linearis TaxID=2823330 RepID=A0ABN7RG51_9BACT|nr:Na+/H+ antiporter NhaA [Dyadobacter sp. CECT 9623]CAG5072660.1 Na(+)/H(+) antiporter NhaA [Dyadobacter sp. CECT 9623]
MANLINLNSFKKFFQSSSTGGIILIICVMISLIIANSSAGPGFEALLATEIGADMAGVHLRYPVLLWINDGLMAVFFLLVGLEIKREMVEGELSSFKKASLPILAAIGGVLAPASIYFWFNSGTPTASGWGIPMATDIAFAIAIISMLGKRAPSSLKIFLSALAIVDDLMAILVIAIFYSTDIHYTYLLYAFGIFIFLLLLNRLKVKSLAAYLIPGLFIWYFIHHSGVHATIAGVLTAFALPTTPDATESPLEKLEHILVNPVNFVIMPIFALANTNIEFEPGMLQGLTTVLGLGIIAGLVIGKPFGITLFSWIAVKLGIGKMPKHASWMHIIGVGMLGGIGFTMSIFIALLSFAGEELILSEAKFSILTASVTSGILGYFWLQQVNKRTHKNK